MKKDFLDFMKKNLIQIICLVVIMIMQIVLILTTPMILQEFIDTLGESNVKKLFLLAIFYIMFNLIRKAIIVLVKYNSEALGWRFFNQLRIWIMRKILQYDRSFYTDHNIGELIEYTERDINIIYSFCTGKMLDMIINLLLIVGTVSILFSKSIGIGFLFLIYIILSFFTIYKIIHTKKDALKEYIAVNSYNIGKYSEWANAHKDLNLMNGVSYVQGKLEVLNEEYKSKEIQFQAYLYRIWSTTLLLTAVLDILALFLGGKLFFINAVSIGVVYLIYSYSELVKEPFENFQSQLQMFMMAKSAYERLKEIISYQVEVSDGERILQGEPVDICADRLSYKYNDGEKLALDQVSLKIEKNEIVGILGKSGSGKTTFCNILAKMLEPSCGKLYLNGVDITQISVTSLRKQMVYLSTNAQLMRGTIRENILLYKENVSNQEIFSKLEQYDFVEYLLPLGNNFLDLNISDVTLSEGQKQLINISRLLFRESSLIVLDEVSSKADQYIQQCLNKIIKALSEQSTIIIVSHDIGVADFCNKVGVFRDSQLIEFDDREKLMKNPNSQYRKIMEQSGVILYYE